MRPVGIDLGTTYSAIAYPEERTGQGFAVLPRCPGVSIILDQRGRRITPSVVAEDSSGQIVVGHLAKARAGFAPEPIMFAKRYMGEDKQYALKKQASLRPEQVSAHILSYLRALAENRLGESVKEAVITVPAYFSMRAIQMTERAGELAGLRVAQIAQEPVAAALMYFAGDPRDPLTIMTYDLGGGTFDVAILEKRDNIISRDSIISYDGDRFLGGYNFDKSLALWMADELCARGYDLQLNLEEAGDRVIFAKLMVLAEAAKIRLSEVETHVIFEQNTGIVDHGGSPVVLDGIELKREDFERIIRPEIERTLDICRRARLEKSSRPIQPDDIDEVIMVGGSSRIPLVARRLQEEYGRPPRLVEPDLCVALGAALIARGLGATLGNLFLNPIPAETDLTEITVEGKVIAANLSANVRGFTIRLRADDGSFDRNRATPENGSFIFDRVPLAPQQSTAFTLTATGGGAEVAQHRFTVRQTTQPVGDVLEPPPNMLARPIGVVLVSGPREVIPARTPLPHKVAFTTKTADASGEIHIPVIEENNVLGQLIIRNVPVTLPLGSAVNVELSISSNFQIQASAKVVSLGLDAKAVVNVPPPPVKSASELREEFAVIEEEAESALATAGPSAVFQDGVGRQLRQRLNQCREMLQVTSPDLSRLQDCMEELRLLVRRLNSGFRPEPPRAVFHSKAEETRAAIAELVKRKPETGDDGYEAQRAAIWAEAEDAFKRQDTWLWKGSYERMVKLFDLVRRQMKADDGTGAGKTAAEQLIELARDLKTLDDRARDRGMSNKLAEARDALARIDPKSPDAWNEIRDWYFSKFEPLLAALDVKRDLKGLTQWAG